MSARDKAIVKAAVEAHLSDPATGASTTPSAVADVVAAQTGLRFGQTTIAAYMKGCGWTRGDAAGGHVPYHRPEAGL